MKRPVFLLLRALLPTVLVPIAQQGAAQYPDDPGALLALSRNAPHDTTKAQALLFLAVRLCDIYPDTVYPLCTASKRIADDVRFTGLAPRTEERRAFRRINATCLLNLGNYFRALGEPEGAMGHYDLSLARFEQAGFAPGRRDALTAMASLLKEQGATAESAELTMKAEALRGQGTGLPYGAIPWERYAAAVAQPANNKPKTAPVKQRYVQGAQDSLRALIRSAKHDTTRAQAMLFLAVLLQQTRPDSAQFFCKESLRIANSRLLLGLSPKQDKGTYRRIKATALLNMAHSYGGRMKLETSAEACALFRHAGFHLGEADAITVASGQLRRKKRTKHGVLISQGEYYGLKSMEDGFDSDAVWVEGELYLSENYAVRLDKKAAALYRKAPRIAYGSVEFDPNAPERGRATGPEPSTEAAVNVQEPLPASTQAAPPPQADRNTWMPTPEDWQQVEPGDADGGTPIAPLESFSRTGEHSALPPPAIDTAAIARHRAHLSRPARRDGGPGAARDHLEQGEALAFLREPALAMSSFEQARGIYHILGSDSGECAALLRIGKLLGDQGAYDRAFAVLDTAHRKARAIGRNDLEGLALAGMADVCQHIDTCGEAAALYRRSITLAHAVKDKHTVARGYIGIAGDLVEKGAFADAEPLGQEGLAIATEVDDADLRQHGASLLQEIYAKLGGTWKAHEMGELVRALAEVITVRDQRMNDSISAMRADMDGTIAYLARALARASDERTVLQENLTGTQAKATRNRAAAILVTLCALAAITGGLLYYRYDRKRRQQRADRTATELDIKALRAQMNPHFLFNALNSINDHIQQSDTDVASDFLVRFSRLMRQVLDMSRLNEVTLQHEIDVIVLYAELERMRLHDRFNVAVNISPDVDPAAVLVPPMILQPFVENAIWHGLSRKEGPGHLWILAGLTDGALRIAVEDDGVGRSASAAIMKKDHTSLGTTITKERLDLWGAQHHAPAGFSYVPAHTGTRVELVLPVVGT